MAMLDLRPQRVDIAGYAGDTLTITITAPSSLVDGMEWFAQVRGVRDSTGVDATFDITPPAVPDGPAYLVLTSAATRALAEEAVGSFVGSTGQYVGEWDCQVSAAGTDPVRTLAQGNLTIDLDVTREEL